MRIKIAIISWKNLKKESEFNCLEQELFEQCQIISKKVKLN